MFEGARVEGDLFQSGCRVPAASWEIWQEVESGGAVETNGEPVAERDGLLNLAERQKCFSAIASVHRGKTYFPRLTQTGL